MGHSMVNAALQMSLGGPRGGERVHAWLIRPGLSGGRPVDCGTALLRPSSISTAPDVLATLPDVSPPVSAETWRSDGWGANRTSMSTAGSFAYPKIHAGTPLPALALAAVASSDGWNADDAGAFAGPTRHTVRCRRGRAAAAVARRLVQRHRRGRAGQRPSGHVLRQSDLAGEQFPIQDDQPGRRARHRAVHP